MFLDLETADHRVHPLFDFYQTTQSQSLAGYFPNLYIHFEKAVFAIYRYEGNNRNKEHSHTDTLF